MCLLWIAHGRLACLRPNRPSGRHLDRATPRPTHLRRRQQRPDGRGGPGHGTSRRSGGGRDSSGLGICVRVASIDASGNARSLNTNARAGAGSPLWVDVPFTHLTYINNPTAAAALTLFYFTSQTNLEVTSTAGKALYDYMVSVQDGINEMFTFYDEVLRHSLSISNKDSTYLSLVKINNSKG